MLNNCNARRAAADKVWLAQRRTGGINLQNKIHESEQSEIESFRLRQRLQQRRASLVALLCIDATLSVNTIDQSAELGVRGRRRLLRADKAERLDRRHCLDRVRALVRGRLAGTFARVDPTKRLAAARADRGPRARSERRVLGRARIVVARVARLRDKGAATDAGGRLGSPNAQNIGQPLLRLGLIRQPVGARDAIQAFGECGDLRVVHDDNLPLARRAVGLLDAHDLEFFSGKPRGAARVPRRCDKVAVECRVARETRGDQCGLARLGVDEREGRDQRDGENGEERLTGRGDVVRFVD